MRLAGSKSRLAMVGVLGAIDAETASAGRFAPDPQAISAIYQPRARFSAWYAATSETIAA
jgi:hypothetical protein